ncbi:GNAT family N-acetyltransferase [Tabrizicola sp. TH137]|uniref:GNAT family N-acetyltransferase n=1 Tax=Tabrizicola sp. TH137 TaxID=2067452 RepID=UPI000C7A1E67|nr:GNAT family N-acetyltransferase [Tabrizicola sp. TH137]PLL12010.1 GNAT family N-acetyltransferase [Tabrizicola sp. TH137]
MTPALLAEVAEATWPPAATHRLGPWLLREGRGGGQRVSAASPAGDWTPDDIPQAEAAMQALGQSPLFVIHPWDSALDAALAARCYAHHDPVVAYAAPTAALADPPPAFLTSFPHWPPLAVAAQLWAEGGIGPGRLAVMDRVQGPKTAILGRTGDRAAGIAFTAIHGNVAMLHALEVAPDQRRKGCAHNILRAAALWARDQGAETLTLLVTERNLAARALYTFLNMAVVGQYHYRKK